MLERLNPIIRLVCLALAGLIVYQLSQLAFKRDVIARSSFNLSAIKTESKSTNSVSTNSPAKKDTNAAPTNAAPASGTAPEMLLPPGVTLPPGVSMPQGMAMAMRGGPSGRSGRGSPGGGPSDLPPEVQAMVEKIKTSQILGPDIKPPPMALLGIAGKYVFLRAPSGQTGMIREGEELGGVKLIRIGTNRVLVEHEKQQKELMIFEGFGGESLMPKTEGKK
jgi:hypothetical protein